MDRWQFFLYQLVLLGGLISTLAQVGLANSLNFFLELLLFFFITSTYTYNRLFFYGCIGALLLRSGFL